MRASQHLLPRRGQRGKTRAAASHGGVEPESQSRRLTLAGASE